MKIEVRIEPPRFLRGRGRRWWAFVAALAVALAVAVPVAWASDLFSDVPNSNPFHDDIGAIARAGITQGCGGGNFCPNDNITRQAEAAFVHRGMPRVGRATANGIPVPSGGADLGDLTMAIPGVPGKTQFVLLAAQVDTQIQSLIGCPCDTTFLIYQDGVGYLFAGDNMNDSLPASGGSASDAIQTGTVVGAIAVPSGTTQTFHIYAFLVGGTGTVTGYGTLSAITAPFGSTGSNVLGSAVGTLSHRNGRPLPAPPK